MRPYTVGNHCCWTNDVAWDEDTGNDEFADDGVVVAAAAAIEIRPYSIFTITFY